MRDTVRRLFEELPPGSKLRAAVDFGVDISLMEPPAYSDHSGHRANRSFREILRALYDSKVDCVIIGGLALVLHGSTRVTLDIDIVYERSRANIGRLVAALQPFRPMLRLHGNKAPVAFSFNAETVWNGGNFTLWTPNFDIDLLASTEDLPSYQETLRQSERIETVGLAFNVLSLDALLRIKRRLNRVKDQLALPEIEALIEIRDLENSDE